MSDAEERAEIEKELSFNAVVAYGMWLGMRAIFDKFHADLSPERRTLAQAMIDEHIERKKEADNALHKHRVAMFVEDEVDENPESWVDAELDLYRAEQAEASGELERLSDEVRKW